jgi:rubredoxin
MFHALGFENTAGELSGLLDVTNAYVTLRDNDPTATQDERLDRNAAGWEPYVAKWASMLTVLQNLLKEDAVPGGPGAQWNPKQSVYYADPMDKVGCQTVDLVSPAHRPSPPHRTPICPGGSHDDLPPVARCPRAQAPRHQIRRPPADRHQGLFEQWQGRTAARDMHQDERRSSLSHELVHDERRIYPTDPVLRAKEEIAVERIAARRLIELGRLVDLLCWTRHADEVAEELWVDMPMLVALIQPQRRGGRLHR